ncbi:WD40 repeat-like protein [Lentinus tigrinus ALCF2SS1-7]|uniref:WD40 repeat-like protein n=1 Tax=Lentinus tigrinus ALCF2SS1-6 TaxID=1328759 RepID=A0A5C2RQ54_9APHY|nr:WD40 repeat-like protein [Lentinus tigrinus ALCF2SS1-6]RPD67645.1 WD40 repeat-like protein [Lentinus tigrinus ALCF2SS1-7]RPD67647.1 WD40 repeat-like protein [Lentinus tigrinus ALCF2SS1-7]
MPLRYKQKVHLNNGHTRGITAVAFSPKGTYVATAGLDGHVCIWRVSDGKLLYRFSGISPVLSITWTGCEESLLFGTKDGNILLLSVCKALNDFSMRGFWAHKYPVEHLAMSGARVASGAFGELKVWQWRDKEQRFVCQVQLPEPPKTSHNEHKEVIVTSLHWMGSTQQPLLVVTYMFHGVQVFDAKTWQSTRTISLHGKIAHASLSADGKHIAVSNLVRGFDVYRLHDETPVGLMTHEVGKPRPTPILFIHNGRALVGGSLSGKVTIWDLNLGKMHTLNIPSKLVVPSELPTGANHLIDGAPVLALSVRLFIPR